MPDIAPDTVHAPQTDLPGTDRAAEPTTVFTMKFLREFVVFAELSLLVSFWLILPSNLNYCSDTYIDITDKQARNKPIKIPLHFIVIKSLFTWHVKNRTHFEVLHI